jgi:hypothetical protein
MMEATQPRLKMLIPKLNETELADLCDWCEGLQARHGVAVPNFCSWLDGAIEHEYRRRQSDGQIEAGSDPLPSMGPKEVSTMLLVLSARSYAPQSQRIGAFFDDVLHHCLALAACQLCEFETLCQAIQQQAGAEQ